MEETSDTEQETTVTEHVTNTEYDMHVVKEAHTAPYLVDLILNGVPVKMELDTGAAASVINELTFHAFRQSSGDLPLHPAESRLKTYTGQEIQVRGTTQLTVQYKDKHLPLTIATCGVWDRPQPSRQGLGYSP